MRTDWLEPRRGAGQLRQQRRRRGHRRRHVRGPADAGRQPVFAALRDLADVVLVGAGTAPAEGYAAVELSARAGARCAASSDCPAVLPTAVVSGRLDLDPTARLFAEAPPATARSCSPARQRDRRPARATLARVADVASAATTTWTSPPRAPRSPTAAYRGCCAKAARRLFAGLAGAGVVDELCLSRDADAAGPGARAHRRPGADAGEPGPPVRCTLAVLLEEDGALFRAIAS